MQNNVHFTSNARSLRNRAPKSASLLLCRRTHPFATRQHNEAVRDEMPFCQMWHTSSRRSSHQVANKTIETSAGSRLQPRVGGTGDQQLCAVSQMQLQRGTPDKRQPTWQVKKRPGFNWTCWSRCSSMTSITGAVPLW